MTSSGLPSPSRLPAPDESSSCPLILVVGARRSGTHLLQRVLSTHPEIVDIPGETYLWSRGIAPLVELFQHATAASPSVGASAYIDRDTLIGHVRELSMRMLEGYRRGSPSVRVLERTPEHALVMPLIEELFPGSSFVHIIRDGRDVVRSLLRMPWGPDDAEAAAEEWVRTVSTARSDGAGLENYVEVRYENLHEQPGEVMGQVLDAVGLAVTTEDRARAVAEARERANTRGLGPATKRLGWADRRAVDRVAGPLLAELGYSDARDSNRDPRRRLRRSQRSTPVGPHDQQWVMDRFLEALRSDGTQTQIEELVGPRLKVEVVGEGYDRLEYGDRAIDLLVEEIARDPALKAVDERASLHAGGPLRVLVSTVSAGGTRHHRVVAVTFTGRRIASVTIHRLGS